MKKIIMIMFIALVAMVSAFAYEVETFSYNGEDTIVLTEGVSDVIGELNFDVRKELTHVSQFEGPVEDAVEYAYDLGYEFGLGADEIYTANLQFVDDNGHYSAVTILSKSYSDYVEVMNLMVSNM